MNTTMATDVYGEMAPMVHAPLEHIQQMQKTGDGNVLYLGKNDGVEFFQTWKPAHARHVLQECEKNYIREPTGARFAPLTISTQQSHENLIIGVDGNKWQEKRKILRGSFIKKYADNFVDLATKCSADQFDTWNSSAENISYQCFNLMFSAILRYVLNTDVDTSTKRGVWRAMPDINRYFHNGLFTQQSIMNESYDQSFGFCRDFFRQAVDDRVAHGDQGQQDLLSSLVKEYDLDDQAERDQMSTDIISVSLAGADAPSLALAWTLYAIALNPEVKSRVTREVDQVLANRQPTRQDLAKLHYTRAVVQESLRMHPPAWYTPRTNVEEDFLDGVRIPAGSTVIVFQYLMHRDAQFWSEAATFDPQRFLGSKNQSAYMPYGWGPRYCFAADYANFMLVTFLALIMRRYDFRLLSEEPPEMDPYINLRMKNDLHFEIERRR